MLMLGFARDAQNLSIEVMYYYFCAAQVYNAVCIRGFLNAIHYINPHFTYLLTYLLTWCILVTG